MTRQQLEQLSKAELIEIILQQQATILQQQALIEQLLARVAQLEELITRLTQPPKDASNSSTPPSKTLKPNRPDRKRKKKRGPKPGHEGRSRQRRKPDVIVECRPASCDHCGADLPQAGRQVSPISREVMDLAPGNGHPARPRRGMCGARGGRCRLKAALQQAGSWLPGLGAPAPETLPSTASPADTPGRTTSRPSWSCLPVGLSGWHLNMLTGRSPTHTPFPFAPSRRWGSPPAGRLHRPVRGPVAAGAGGTCRQCLRGGGYGRGRSPGMDDEGRREAGRRHRRGAGPGLTAYRAPPGQGSGCGAGSLSAKPGLL